MRWGGSGGEGKKGRGDGEGEWGVMGWWGLRGEGGEVGGGEVGIGVTTKISMTHDRLSKTMMT